MRNYEQQPLCAGRTMPAEALGYLKSRMPHLDELFENLEAGVTPTFLDVMSSFSEMVAFYTDCDQFDEVLILLDEKMSGKKCRFCS